MTGPDETEIRVLGCLLEKQRTTPDQYPLTLNSLRLACNQSTNRSPVVEYDEATVRRALGELGRRRWIRSASGHTSRASKYRQLIDTELGLDQDQLAVLAVLMLRGPQTPGELKQRTERLFAFHDLDAIHTTLDALIGRELVERLPRRPGQKEERYRQLLGGQVDEDADHGQTADLPGSAGSPATDGAATDGSGTGTRAADGSDTRTRAADGSGTRTPTTDGPPADIPAADSGGEAAAGEAARIDRLERELAELRAELAELRDRLTP